MLVYKPSPLPTNPPSRELFSIKFAHKLYYLLFFYGTNIPASFIYSLIKKIAMSYGKVCANLTEYQSLCMEKVPIKW